MLSLSVRLHGVVNDELVIFYFAFVTFD